jgi:hypothetical protein
MYSLRRTALWILVAWVTPAVSQAEIYQYVDEQGILHFTNVPTADKRYRPVGKPDRVEKKRSKKRRRTFFRHKLLTRYEDHIQEASRRFNIPQSLIRAVMAVESNFNPQAVSSAGAQGLMQLMPPTAAEMGVEDSFDPRQNILGGTRYLRKLANEFEGDLVLTLAAYNAGQTAVNRHMDIPPYAETQRYVRRVLKLYYYYKEQSEGPSFAKATEGRHAR